MNNRELRQHIKELAEEQGFGRVVEMLAHAADDLYEVNPLEQSANHGGI